MMNAMHYYAVHLSSPYST